MGTVCAFVDFAIATLFVALALPLALRKVRMNIWYGLRIPQAYLSNESWCDINEYGGKQMLLWSLPAVVAGICCLLFPFEALGQFTMTVVPVLLTAGALICVALMPTIRTIKYAARQYPGSSSGILRSMFDMGYNPEADKQGLTKYSALTVVFVLLFHLSIITTVILLGFLVRGRT